MKTNSEIGRAAIIVLLLLAAATHAHPGPFDGKEFKGRIAFSSDGNCNDEDDWGAFPVAVALLDAFGVKDKLVHVDYCNILPQNDPRFYQEMVTSVLGSAERYDVPRAILFDCQKDLDGAVASIAGAINSSSADNPLYYVLAGPMEVPLLGIRRSDPNKRKYVYCISHSRWNDGFPQKGKEYLHRYSKRDVIETGIRWVQVETGAGLTNSSRTRSTPQQWALYHWMRDSRDSRLRWIYTRLEVEDRCDVSDATMTYFLLTGDQQATPEKLKPVLNDGKLPAPAGPRDQVRIEAENFQIIENYELENRNDRRASHRLSVRQSKSGTGRIRTLFDRPYTVDSGLCDVEIRHFDGKDGRSELRLYVNGVQKGRSRTASADTDSWRNTTVSGVTIRTGDDIMVQVRADGGETGRLDYVQLNYRSPASNASRSPSADRETLDDTDALPGQIIVAGANPGYLKYNGGGPAFLCGPDNPETFLFLGDLNPDGTRSNGQQQSIIDRLVKSGANAFHFQMFRMRRCNIKDEGDDQHCPFVDFDPSQPLNRAMLDQWDGWISQLEKAGVVIHLEFYNDATDVERMGWTLDENGDLHPDEKRFFAGIVERFKHHKNIIWGIEESVNKLPRARTPHFKKLSELIAQLDNYHHPIVHSFVTPETSEKDLSPDNVMSDEYISDSHIKLVTWLHVLPHGRDYEAQHRAYLKYSRIDSDRFIVMKNETERFPRTEPQSRIYQWSCAMTGMHTLEAGHDVVRRQNLLAADGNIARFMEQTDFYRMTSRDDLAAGSTKWVLARPGSSYIAYTYDYSGPMGIRNMTAGTYDLTWFDATDGNTVTQSGVSVRSGDVTWPKPASRGSEIALYICRSASGNGGS